MPDHVIKKQQLADIAGVSRAYITQETKEGGSLRAAIVGPKINLAHPVVQEWLQSRSRLKTTGDPQIANSTRPAGDVTPSAGLKPVEYTDAGTSESIAKIADFTVREVVEKFGGEHQFANWLKDMSVIEVIRERRLKNEEREGTTVSRTLVETAIFSLLEDMNQRMLVDLPKSLARSIQALSVSGAPIEACEREVRSVIGKTLEATKTKISRKLEALE